MCESKEILNCYDKTRVASHRLEVEVGRWARPNREPVDERKCRHCNMLEDEFHFLLECSLHREFRMQYIKRYFGIDQML